MVRRLCPLIALVAVIVLCGACASTPLSPAELQLAPPLTGHSSSVIGLAFSRDGKMLASGSDDGSVILWDVQDPVAPTQFCPPLGEWPCCVWSLALSPDGRILASSTPETYAWKDVIYLWDVSDPKAPVPLRPPLEGGHDKARSLAFSPDGRILAAGNEDNTVTLWDMADPTAPALMSPPLEGHQYQVQDVAFGPDGRVLASADFGVIMLWSVSDPKAPARLATISGLVGVSDLAFSPDGKTLAAGGYDVHLWNVSKPKAPVELEVLPTGVETAVASLDFSPDGRMLACSTGDMAILWDVSNRRAPARLGALLGHKDSVSSVAFSPDGQTLATGSADATIILWNVSKPNLARLPPVPTPIRPIECPATPDEEEYAVYAAVLSPDSRGQTFVIIDHTTGNHGENAKSMPGLDPEAFIDYIAKTHHNCALDGAAFERVGVTFVPVGGYPGPDQWDAFYSQDPGSTGVISLSRVGFNTHREKAFVCSGQMKGDLYGAGYCFTLEKQNGRWIVLDSSEVWIS